MSHLGELAWVSAVGSFVLLLLSWAHVIHLG